MNLSDRYFGDVEAIDEGKNHPDYFKQTFVRPESFSTSSLNNKRKYIIVGRKGAGKTAVQFQLSTDLESQGFLTHFFSFYDGLKPKDYNAAGATQRIDILKTENIRNIFLNYDFREVWERTLLVKLAETFKENDMQTKFTSFCLQDRGPLSSIFDGILKSTNIKLSADMMGISADVGVDLSEFVNEEIPISKFNLTAREILKKYHDLNRAYIFVDELVISKLDAQDDEVRVRAAMVRDIFRSCRTLNNFFSQSDLDFHIVCTVRPEIRDLINDLDSEIGKVFDGKSVDLSWDVSDGDDSLLYRLLKQKVIYSGNGGVENFSDLVSEEIEFGNTRLSIEEFLRTNTWARPRDIVQLLNSIADKNPNSKRISGDEIKNALNEYGRRSFSEIVEEISVKHGGKIASQLRQSIHRQEYRDFSHFQREVLDNFTDLDQESLLTDLFNFGVIGNVERRAGPSRYYWFHRGEEYFKKQLGVSIHRGLWNYFNIR